MTDVEVELEDYPNERVEREFEVKEAPSTSKLKVSKTVVIKLVALVLLFVVLLAVFIAIFGVGFGVGWASNPGDNEDNSSKHNQDDNDNDNDNGNDDGGKYVYDYYQGYPYVYRSPADYQLNRTNTSEAVIMESNEYQFKLNTTKFINRTQGVEELYALVAEVLQITINQKKIEEDVFVETQYQSTNCGSIAYSELRVRNYYGGKLDDSSECDINMDAHPHSSKANAMSYNLAPNPDYDNEQKMEQDVHPCWYKFNKKTKIKNLPGNFTFETCADCLEILPNSFPGANPDAPISKKSVTYFWESKYHTYMQFDISKIKLSFDLAYGSLEDAMSGDIKPRSGESEFSIRFYSPNDGFSYWNYKLLSEMGADYLYLLDNYGSTDYPCKR